MNLQWPLMVVTPTIDGRVLSVLALADVSFTTGQLARLIPNSEEGLRRVLKRLTGQGIVLADRVGPAVAYRFNHEHLAAQPILELAGLRSTLLRRLEDLLETWAVPPVYGAVFGSVGRGDPTESSDVDIFLVRPQLLIDDATEELWTVQVDGLIRAVRSWTGNSVQVVEFDEAELAKDEPLLDDIHDQGLTIFGEPSWFRRAVRGPRSQ